MNDLKVFIGSSGSSSCCGPIANGLEMRVKDLRARVWNEGVFTLNRGVLERLLEVMDQYDFAVMVWAADDVTESKGESSASPRQRNLRCSKNCASTPKTCMSSRSKPWTARTGYRAAETTPSRKGACRRRWCVASTSSPTATSWPPPPMSWRSAWNPAGRRGGALIVLVRARLAPRPVTLSCLNIRS